MTKTPTVTSSLVISGFHALSEPLRIQIIELLQQRELCVCDLCQLLEVSQSKLSFHLKTLKEANLVFARQEGRWIYYRLNLAQFAVLQDYLTDYCQLPSILPALPCQDTDKIDHT
ncbi:ArsR/SmtB family transcription factor [Calothrix sp. 336/3]|uniref:ArsR/SmtB family transcription factor n=1 Tax=Calothrix sp. 336/3 TaxID=1337936 RepID=UPI0004E2AD6B|nr:metalloregulator ArsR/SmtB family transcription factor [Calothrix sp. 336/3]AKG22782.1 hypothetical protein IJ00_17225 [Calothrix sp. 336/3]